MKKESMIPVFGALAAAGAVYAFYLRPRHLQWGATEEEAIEPLPGDEFVVDATQSATHAITINAPVDRVWPWLAQIGQDKGGFYSYTLLENMVGCHMHNADAIHPEWQDLRPGDSVRLHPKVPPLPLLLLEPNRALVMGSNTSEPGTWGLYLKPIDDHTTRLIIRGRGRGNGSIASWIGHYLLLEPAHFVMERKMMMGIKARAEAAMQQTETQSQAMAVSH